MINKESVEKEPSLDEWYQAFDRAIETMAINTSNVGKSHGVAQHAGQKCQDVRDQCIMSGMANFKEQAKTLLKNVTLREDERRAIRMVFSGVLNWLKNHGYEDEVKKLGKPTLQLIDPMVYGEPGKPR